MMHNGNRSTKEGAALRISRLTYLSERRSSAARDAFMANQALSFAENLTVPKVQVIVMRANMECTHCRQRVSNIVSKMNGLLDYMVDFRKKEVIVRGLVDTKKTKAAQVLSNDKETKWIYLCKLMCCCSSF